MGLRVNMLSPTSDVAPLIGWIGDKQSIIVINVAYYNQYYFVNAIISMMHHSSKFLTQAYDGDKSPPRGGQLVDIILLCVISEEIIAMLEMAGVTTGQIGACGGA